MYLKTLFIPLILTIISVNAQLLLKRNNFNKLVEVFSWKQLKYEIDGVKYTGDSNFERKPDGFFFDEDELEDREKFFIQYNNVPVGFEVDTERNRAFITVPRRRFGIPSTLNYVDLRSGSEPELKPYPNVEKSKELVSVYRPRVDACGRLWMVDTGLLEVPNNRRQIKPPAIIIFDLKTDEQLLRHEINSDLLVNNRTSGGLTSITVDVSPSDCGDAFAYINDLATDSLIVFSLKQKTAWRFQHNSLSHDAGATNFKVGDNEIPWTDGLFSIALSSPDGEGSRTAYYHPFVATQEFSIPTAVLKNSSADFGKNFKLEGVRGVYSQSGSHDFDPDTRTLLFANIAQDAIQCWNINMALRSSNVAVAAQDHEKLLYISDLKVIGDEVWLLTNRMSKFVFSTLNYADDNFHVYRVKVRDLINGTSCEQ